MTDATDDNVRSGNEIETLVLKAARGGGLALGLAEDLAAAAVHLNLNELSHCPCHSGAAEAIPAALDRVLAGQRAQRVVADRGLIDAYVAALETQSGRSVQWSPTDDGAVFECVSMDTPAQHVRKGRRAVPADLAAHLAEMGSKILVPETDASRLAGAGAGLTDND